MDNFEEVIKEHIKGYSKEEQLIVRFKHNIMPEDNSFLKEYIDCINNSKVLEESLASTSFTKERINYTLKYLSENIKEEQMLLLLESSLKNIKDLENNFLQVKFINSYNIIDSFYNIMNEVDFTQQFYTQLLNYIKQYFSSKIDIILMNINYDISLKLGQYNGLLLDYPPTKKIKQLRFIEYVQNYLLLIKKVKKEEITTTDIVKEYGYMLKVIKNNKKELMEIEHLENTFKKEKKISFINDDDFLAFKKSINPNYHEKNIINNEEDYEKILIISKRILSDYNKVNGIKTKKRKGK